MRLVGHRRRRHAGDPWFEPEQPAGERLLLERVGAKQVPRGGREGASQIGPSEGDLGDVGYGEGDRFEERALGRIAPRFPSRIEADPDAPFGIDGGPVGMAFRWGDADNLPRGAQPTLRANVAGGDRPRERVDPVKPFPLW